MIMPLRLVLAVLLLVASTSSCAGFRSMTMGIANTDMQGRTAPPVEGLDWVLSAGEVEPTAGVPDWQLYVFFLPG